MNRQTLSTAQHGSELTTLPDPLILIRSERGMWGRCVAKYGSSFPLEELNKICCKGMKLKDNKARFLFNIVSVSMSLSGLKHLISKFYAAEVGGCYTISPLCVSLCFNPHSGPEPSSFPFPPSTSPPSLLVCTMTVQWLSVVNWLLIAIQTKLQGF